jgi:replication factor A2
MWATGRESFGDFNAGAAAGGYAPGGGGGGGFVANAGQNDPGTSGEKKMRGKTIGPATIRQLVQSKEDILKIEDMEISTVIIIGLVKHVDVTSTRVSFIIDDQTGVIEAVQHVGADDGVLDTATILAEGTYGRVVGLLRAPTKGATGKKYLLIHKVTPVIDVNEITVHILEVLQLSAKLKQMKAGLDAKINAVTNGLNNAVPSAMFGTTFGAGDVTLGRIDMGMGRTSAGGAAAGGNMNNLEGHNGFTTHQNLILNILKNCQTESGLHKDEIMQNVKNKMTPKQVETVLEYLSGEGHIFSTVDDDHFKVTDW